MSKIHRKMEHMLILRVANATERVHGNNMPESDRIAARLQDASCVSSASLGAPESGTLLSADAFDVQASFEVPAHECPCHMCGKSAALHAFQNKSAK